MFTPLSPQHPFGFGLEPTYRVTLFLLGADLTADFVQLLRQRCQATPKHIAFPDSDDVRVLTAADTMLREGSVASVTLFTGRDETLALAARSGVQLDIWNDLVRFATGATDIPSRLQQAAALLTSGTVDAAVAGNIATTAQVIRAGIKGVGLAPGVRTVSGAFVMHKANHSPLLFADCGVVIAPTQTQLVDIAVGTVRTWQQLFPEVAPVVAFLSFSTKGSAKHPAQEQSAAATAAFQALMPEIRSDGELQFDAAVDPDICNRKAPGSAVAGQANCFIFPSLEAGNIAYKITQRLGGYGAFGPILQGLARPFSDLSRGATVADIIASAYINLLAA